MSASLRAAEEPHGPFTTFTVTPGSGWVHTGYIIRAGSIYVFEGKGELTLTDAGKAAGRRGAGGAIQRPDGVQWFLWHGERDGGYVDPSGDSASKDYELVLGVVEKDEKDTPKPEDARYYTGTLELKIAYAGTFDKKGAGSPGSAGGSVSRSPDFDSMWKKYGSPAVAGVLGIALLFGVLRYMVRTGRKAMAEEARAAQAKQVIACPHCSQNMRVPSGAGKIRVTCPACKEVFVHES
ncbi:hypothetical protein [Prosthecobacter sp.]|uniref:hypothetical protein n=1 Tax=Prosthecobacter sp. TaxID=1965333 RepID=UPI003783BA80